MFNRILIVCTGNICRSPMAAELLRSRLQTIGIPATVESAGTGALVGSPAEPHAIALLQERGLDLSRHRARQVTPGLLRPFDLVLTMDRRQQQFIEELDRSLRGRVHRLGRVGDFDVPDPYRQGREAFESALAFIERGLDELQPIFWSPT